MSQVKSVSMICTWCGKPIGEFFPNELLEMEGFDWGGVLCFDCDNASGDTVPSLFWQWHPGEDFYLDDHLFTVNADRTGLMCLSVSEQVRMRTHACACLSSSTYLNTQKQKGGLARACFHCETGGMWYTQGGWKCEQCGTFEPEFGYLVFPKWILGEGA